MSAASDMQYLFGGPKPWNTSNIMWTAVDDRVRGGSSQSYLDVFTNDQRQQDHQSAKFYGVLDTTTLGGAGFASQSAKPVSGPESSSQIEVVWDLSAYDGLCLAVYTADDKLYTLTLKDELPSQQRSDGREQSGITWEADFRIPAEMTDRGSGLVTSNQHAAESTAGFLVKLPWSKFKATYRGRDMPDAKPLRTSHIQRFSLMMRSFFEKQHGPFELVVDYLAAYRVAE